MPQASPRPPLPAPPGRASGRPRCDSSPATGFEVARPPSSQIRRTRDRPPAYASPARSCSARCPAWRDRRNCSGDRAVPFSSGQPDVTKKRLGQLAHFADRQLVGLEPAHFGGLISVRSRRSLPHRRIEDRHDISRLVAVRIGHSVLGTSEDAKDVAQIDLDTGLLPGLSDGTVTGRLVWFDRTANGGPVPRIDEAHEKEASSVISRQH